MTEIPVPQMATDNGPPTNDKFSGLSFYGSSCWIPRLQNRVRG